MSVPAQELGLVEQLPGPEMDRGLRSLWQNFSEICSIPRKSRNEGLIASYLTEFAGQRKLTFETDTYGNLLIELPATEGYENTPGIVVQGHMDMVCLGKPDPAKFGVQPYVDESGQWVTADTTLGADNGIGVAAMMALCDDKSFVHGPLALMINRTEEVGLIGAKKMSFTNKLEGYSYLINVDSEDEGEVTISSAGAGDTFISLPLEKVTTGNKKIVSLSIDGLEGGHSGVVIGKGRLNAVKVMTDVLDNLLKESGMLNIVSVKSGKLRNVIPSKAKALIAVDEINWDRTSAILSSLTDKFRREGGDTDPNINITALESKELPEEMLSNDSTLRVLSLLKSLPNGVVKWNEEVEGLQQTSTNLAVVKTDKSQLKIQMMTRSSVEEELAQLRDQIKQISQEYRAKVRQSAPYSGWEPDFENPLLPIINSEWEKISGSPVKTVATHGGLECGVIMGYYPHLRAVALGPTVKKAHEEGERVLIDSVSRFYPFLKNILSSVARQDS